MMRVGLRVRVLEWVVYQSVGQVDSSWYVGIKPFVPVDIFAVIVCGINGCGITVEEHVFEG